MLFLDNKSDWTVRRRSGLTESKVENQGRLRDRFQQFAEDQLGASRPELEQQERFNREGWRHCAEFGVMALPADPAFGGDGAGMLRVIEAFEGLGYGCRDNGLLFAVGAHIWGCLLPVGAFGSSRLKKRFVPSLAAGESIGGLAVSEPKAGSDAFNLAASARRDGDHYVLDGVKTFVTNGTVADVVVVLARHGQRKGPEALSAFLVEKDSPGFQVEKKLGKMGLRTAEMARIQLAECRIPIGNRIGPEGIGQSLFTHVMEWERACIMAPAVGSMQFLLDRTIRYAKQRVQFEQPISRQPEVAARILQMKTRVDTSRLLLHNTGQLKEEGQSVLLEACLAKLYVSECWVKNCLDAMAVHGGYGYLTDFEIEKELRDAMGSQFYSGTAEIQRRTAAAIMGL